MLSLEGAYLPSLRPEAFATTSSGVIGKCQSRSFRPLSPDLQIIWQWLDMDVGGALFKRLAQDLIDELDD